MAKAKISQYLTEVFNLVDSYSGSIDHQSLKRGISEQDVQRLAAVDSAVPAKVFVFPYGASHSVNARNNKLQQDHIIGVSVMGKVEDPTNADQLTAWTDFTESLMEEIGDKAASVITAISTEPMFDSNLLFNANVYYAEIGITFRAVG